jgi:hypothetical protein
MHPPDKILAAVEKHGFRTMFNDRGMLWQVVALERAASS